MTNDHLHLIVSSWKDAASMMRGREGWSMKAVRVENLDIFENVFPNLTGGDDECSMEASETMHM